MAGGSRSDRRHTVLMKLRKRQMAVGFVDMLKKRLAKKETVH